MNEMLRVFIDGASKGNPGPSGIGVVIYRNSEIIKEICRYIGQATNNIAEYTALICGLLECLSMKADSVSVKTDSQLLYCQLNGQYKVKSPHIKELYDQAQILRSKFRNFSITHIPREENAKADKLADEAVKKAKKD